MEGVPRLNMLSFPLKRSADSPDFRTNIKRFISQHYSEDPQTYSQEISTLESLRASAVHASRDFTGIATLKKYFCQLHYLKSRFPFQEGSSIAISFSWYDAFSDQVHGWKDIDFEMASILYNIGALHSDLGTKDARLDADGMKTSCTHFQCAAWAFQHMKNDYYKFFSSDLSSDILNIMTNICLAQAQECILEKSLIDNRKSAIIAKVSLQIVDYYQLTRKAMDAILKKSHGHSDKVLKAVKKWRELVEVKIHYYSCVSYLYRGLQSEEQSKFGERITFFKAGMEKLTEAIKLAHSMDKADSVVLMEALNFTMDVLGTKLSTSEKENEFIYHEKVPTLESLDLDFKGVSLVKGIPFKFDDPEIAGSDIFARLVPMEAHEASSLYSEEKAKILRSYSTKVEEKNEELDRFLIAIQLDQLDIHSEEMKVPQALIECCARLSCSPDTVKKLSSLMSKLSGMFHDVEHNIKEINEILKAEDVKEKEFQEIVGKRPPDSTLSEISREVKKYQHAHGVASESNQTLHDAMRVHVVNLQILMKPLSEVLKHIPSVGEIGEKDESAIKEMKRLRGKIEEMQKQRETLLSQLRDSILNDDITKSLVVKQDQGLENVFEEELKKHEKITNILDQNLHAQDNILRALTEANASYAETRKATEAVLKKRDKSIDALLGSYDAYNDLVIKCTQGVEFYTKLDANVFKLLERARAAIKAREEEREEHTNAILKTTSQNARDPALNAPNNMSIANPQSHYYYKNLATSTANNPSQPYNLYTATSTAGDVNVMNSDPIQQQYEKNLALQQEYEKLQKLQQQIAKESSHVTAQHNIHNPYNYAVSSQQQQYSVPNLNYTSATTTTITPPVSGQYGTSSSGVPTSSVQPSTIPSQQQQNYAITSNFQTYPTSSSSFSTPQPYFTPSNESAPIITSQQQYQHQQPYNNSSYITPVSLTPTSTTFPTNNPPNNNIIPTTTTNTTQAVNAPQMYPNSSSSQQQQPQQQQQYGPQSVVTSSASMPFQYNMQQQYSHNPLLEQYSQQYSILGQNSINSTTTSMPTHTSYDSNPVLEESKQRFEKLMAMQNPTMTTNTYGQQPILSPTSGSSQYGGEINQQYSNVLYSSNSQTNPTSYNNPVVANPTTSNWTAAAGPNVTNYSQQQQQQPSQDYHYSPAYNNLGYNTANNYYCPQPGSNSIPPPVSNHQIPSYPPPQQQQHQQRSLL